MSLDPSNPLPRLPEWKERYLDALDQLETIEKQWSQIESTIRRGFASIATAIPHTGGYELNQRLFEIGNSISHQNAEEKLQKLFEATNLSIRPKGGDKLATTPQRYTADLPLIFQQITRNLTLPIRTQPALQSFEQALQKIPPDDQNGLIHAFTRFLEQIAAPLPPFQLNEPEPAPPALEEKLIAIKQILQELIDHALQGHPTQTIYQQRLKQSKNENALHALIYDLSQELQRSSGKLNTPPSEILIRLLERIDIPLNLHADLESIKQKLHQGIAEDSIETILKAIADLIQAMRNREQREKSELESFLKQLTSYLHDIDSHIQAQLGHQKSALQAGEELQNDVESNVNQLASHLSTVKDIADLKQAIQSHMVRLQQRMSEFRSSEVARQQQAEEQIRQLTQQLDKVKQESEGLREQLANHLQVALIDPLTGIPNRLAYNERVEQEISRWQRYHRPLCMAVWDVDFFKRVNDNYGHLAGDKVLTVIAKLLSKQIRKTDFVARFGGEEFIMLLPETSLATTMKVVDLLRQKIANCEFHFRDQRVPVTASCGVALASENDTIESLFRRADEALYLAKKSGRNRCCHQDQLTT